MSRWWTEGRQAWLELEELKAQAPRDDGHCRKCGADAGGESLCVTCDAQRIAGMQRFGGRAGSSNPHQNFRRETTSRPEWFPYKD